MLIFCLTEQQSWRSYANCCKRTKIGSGLMSTNSPLKKLSIDQKPIVLTCNASPFGIDTILSHILDSGTKCPIAYALYLLSPAEKRYSKLDKEALTVVFGVCKFYCYLWGRRFHCTVIYTTDTYFRESKSVPVIVSALLQRWVLTLSSYMYTI